MVRWIGCLSGCAKEWPPGEQVALRERRLLNCLLRSRACSLFASSISSAPILTLGESVICLLAHRRWGAAVVVALREHSIELLARFAGVFAYRSFDQQRADTDARRHYDGR
jgi:hypothetical protein